MTLIGIIDVLVCAIMDNLSMLKLPITVIHLLPSDRQKKQGSSKTLHSH